MKKSNIFIYLILFAFFGVFFRTQNTFAANEFGIEYSGGVDLGEYVESGVTKTNVQANPDLINSLTPLITGGNGFKLTFSNSSKWEKGYFKKDNGSCTRIGYIKSNALNGSSNDVYYTMTQGGYLAKSIVKKIVIDGLVNTDDDPYAVMVRTDGGVVRFALNDVYSDSTCETLVPGIKPAMISDNLKFFVELELKLYAKNDTSKIATSDQLYFVIGDIDSAQSCQIRNRANGVDVLSKENMFAKDLINLQPTAENIETQGNLDLRNKYVTANNSGYNYIYSQYGADGSTFNINPKIGGNIYARIDESIQKEGLDLVFGFARGGASTNVQYYAKQYRVVYESDDFGKIIGITDENLMSGDNPSGSRQEADDGYHFVYWIADQDVTLDDGTVIKKGEKLTDEQILRVVVHQNITFKAIHEQDEEEVLVPNTGNMTSEMGGGTFVLGLTIPVVLMLTFLIYHVMERRKSAIDFRK